jgi:hypothetical protein
MFEATYSVLGMRNFPVSVSYLSCLTAEAVCPSSQLMTHKVSRMSAAIIMASVEDSQEGVEHQSVTIYDKVFGVDCLLQIRLWQFIFHKRRRIWPRTRRTCLRGSSLKTHFIMHSRLSKYTFITATNKCLLQISPTTGIKSLLFVCSFVCLFSWRYNQSWLYFHSPVAGFSLLVFEVSWSHTTTRHIR